MAYGYNHDCDVISQIYIHQAIEKAFQDQEMLDRKSIKSQQREETLRAKNFVKSERSRLRKSLNAVRIACHGYNNVKKTKLLAPEKKSKRAHKSNIQSKEPIRNLHLCEMLSRNNLQSSLGQIHLNNSELRHNFFKLKKDASPNSFDFNFNDKLPPIKQINSKPFGNEISKHSHSGISNCNENTKNSIQTANFSDVKSYKLPLLSSSVPNAINSKSQQISYNRYYPVHPRKRNNSKNHSGCSSGSVLIEDSRSHKTTSKTTKSAPSHSCYQSMIFSNSPQEPPSIRPLADSQIGLRHKQVDVSSNFFSKHLFIRYDISS